MVSHKAVIGEEFIYGFHVRLQFLLRLHLVIPVWLRIHRERPRLHWWNCGPKRINYLLRRGLW